MFYSKAGISDIFEGHYGPATGIDTHSAAGPIDFSYLFLTSSFDWTIKLWSHKVSHRKTKIDYKTTGLMHICQCVNYRKWRAKMVIFILHFGFSLPPYRLFLCTCFMDATSHTSPVALPNLLFLLGVLYYM